MGDAMAALFNPLDGYHVYFSVPEAFSCRDLPMHKVSGLLMESLKGYTTVSETESLATHPLLLVPVTVYFMDESGRAKGVAQSVHERLIAGLHE